MEIYIKMMNNNIKWEKISLPNENSKFLQCACGDKHLICLIEDNTGKGKIYAMGDNNNYQCGIYEKNNNEGDRKFIKILTKCSEISQLNFKTVFANQDFSAAISVDNKLYIWGYLNKADYREVRKPTLVKNNIKSQIVFDKIYIGIVTSP